VIRTVVMMTMMIKTVSISAVTTTITAITTAAAVGDISLSERCCWLKCTGVLCCVGWQLVLDVEKDRSPSSLGSSSSRRRGLFDPEYVSVTLLRKVGNNLIIDMA
jgi:hypothetical protein